MAMLRLAVVVLMLSSCGLSDPADVPVPDRSAQSTGEGDPREPPDPDPAPGTDPYDSDGDGTPD
jgi:hypothetical protein